MSEIRRRLESILVVDCGSTTTKAVLLDLVASEYRLVAYAESASTAGKPWEDVSAGVVSAIARLEAISGRRLLDEHNQLLTPEREDGSGVDRLMAISSAARPLRVLLTGLIPDVSLASARRAALSTYTDIVGTLPVLSMHDMLDVILYFLKGLTTLLFQHEMRCILFMNRTWHRKSVNTRKWKKNCSFICPFRVQRP